LKAKPKCLSGFDTEFLRSRLNDYSISGLFTWLKQRKATEIGISGKRKHLGMFSPPEKAQEAYKTAAIKYFGEFGRSP